MSVDSAVEVEQLLHVHVCGTVMRNSCRAAGNGRETVVRIVCFLDTVLRDIDTAVHGEMEILQEIQSCKSLDSVCVGVVVADIVAVVLDAVSVQLGIALDTHVVVSVVIARAV